MMKSVLITFGFAAAHKPPSTVTECATDDTYPVLLTTTFDVNLDAPTMEERYHFLNCSDPMWANKTCVFEHAKDDIYAYVSQYVPAKWEYELITAGTGWLGDLFPKEYIDEMHAIANNIGCKFGEVVLINLIYEVSGLGTPKKYDPCQRMCPQNHQGVVSNTTGPCPSSHMSTTSDEEDYDKKPARIGCTGLIAKNDKGQIWHGRNLDWNLSSIFNKYIMQLNYKQDGELLYSGVAIAGMVGLIHGMNDKFSISMNARPGVEKLVKNIGELIVHKKNTFTVFGLIRRTLETQTGYTDAVDMLSDKWLVTPCYFIVGNGQPKDDESSGAVISRRRDGPDYSAKKKNDMCPLPGNGDSKADYSKCETESFDNQPDSFRLQTNYDHWLEDPAADQRRWAGANHTMERMEKNNRDYIDYEDVWTVITEHPTKNFHTDITSIMMPHNNTFHTWVWYPTSNNTKTEETDGQQYVHF